MTRSKHKNSHPCANLAAAIPPRKTCAQLATRAVELTEYRYPVMIGTLAAAYAQKGNFSSAAKMAQIAHDLALVTNQKDVAVKNAEFSKLYLSRQTVSESQAN